ncbi:hypothetical protein [Streptomyces sp. NPDC047046]|uniref:hypothetical protein n=1 Tax=Streptomyces sp. NPDC047046 TaxID=3155378 RepID=UPI0033F96565
MVTSQHEASHRVFQDRPELLGPVFRMLGVPLPPKLAVDVLNSDVTEIRPIERRIDSVLHITPSEGKPFLLAIEAQGRKAPDKAATWTYYLGYLAAKYQCPANLLVVCTDEHTARWAEGPFELGGADWPSLTLRPLVAGPHNVPLITDPAEAADDLALAVFSVLTHASHRLTPETLRAVGTALRKADTRSSEYFFDIVNMGLAGTGHRALWEDIMRASYFPGSGTLLERTFLEGKAEGEATGKTEGKAEGKISLLLKLLDAHGVSLTEDATARINACTDLDTLDTWFDRALTARTIAEVLDPTVD